MVQAPLLCRVYDGGVCEVPLRRMPSILPCSEPVPLVIPEYLLYARPGWNRRVEAGEQLLTLASLGARGRRRQVLGRLGKEG